MTTTIDRVGLEIEGEWTAEGAEEMRWKGVQFKRDGSISSQDGGMAWELVTAPKRPNKRLFMFLDKLDKVERAGGYKYNETMGFHVHMSFSNGKTHYPFEVWSKQFNAYFLYKLEKQFPQVWESRKNNRYCRAYKHRSDAEVAEPHSRYQAVNYQAYGKHGTVEFRIFPADSAVNMRKYLEFTIETVRGFLLKNRLRVATSVQLGEWLIEESDWYVRTPSFDYVEPTAPDRVTRAMYEEIIRNNRNV